MADSESPIPATRATTSVVVAAAGRTISRALALDFVSSNDGTACQGRTTGLSAFSCVQFPHLAFLVLWGVSG